MASPYYEDDLVQLWLGDCRDIGVWLQADVLVTDPPYGRGWSQGRTAGIADDSHQGIEGDAGTSVRDAVIAAWGPRHGVVFGDQLIDRPAGARQALGYRKPPASGSKGTFGGFRRDLELIYLIGPWEAGLNGRSSVLVSGATGIGGTHGLTGRYGHPHAKPVDVMECLIQACPPGTVADPFAGAGSTLVAARNLGRRAVGVEIDKWYCELAARRLRQQPLEASCR